MRRNSAVTQVWNISLDPHRMCSTLQPQDTTAELFALCADFASHSSPSCPAMLCSLSSEAQGCSCCQRHTSSFWRPECPVQPWVGQTCPASNCSKGWEQMKYWCQEVTERKQLGNSYFFVKYQSP